MSLSPTRYIALLLRSFIAHRYAVAKNIPGIEYARFGRKLGLKLALRGNKHGYGYMVTPVNIVRYFEFEFAHNSLGNTLKNCLDVSSPRLFSIACGQRSPKVRIRMVNPNTHDIECSRSICKTLGIRNIDPIVTDVRGASTEGRSYDAIWSLSVLEHIHGEYDDVQAAQMLFGMLRGEGRLVLTVPVDKSQWDEYRESPVYNGNQHGQDGRFFFQRYYDRDGIWDRIVASIGVTPSKVAWYGEKAQGIYQEYERKWIRAGLEATANDARLIADSFKEYDSWQDMPGQGVCGLVFDRHL